MMSDRTRESVSAFMDGEADEITVHRLLVREDDVLIRDAWTSFHRQRRVFQGSDLRFEQMDVSLSVMAALADEPAHKQRDQSVWLKPVAGFAVAASVAAVVVMGAPNWRQAGVETAPTVAANTSTISGSDISLSALASASSAQYTTASIPESIYVDKGDTSSASGLHFSQRVNGTPVSWPVTAANANNYSAYSPAEPVFIYSDMAYEYPQYGFSERNEYPMLHAMPASSDHSAFMMFHE